MDVRCLSNQRQTVLAASVYANDYDDFPWNGLTAVDVALPSGETGRFAPHWVGAEGYIPFWRRWLREGGYADTPRVLGCARPPPITGWWQFIHCSSNGYDTFDECRETPPFTYIGPGTDTIRAATYAFDVLNPWGGDNYVTRRGRSIRLPYAAPLFYDIRWRPYPENVGERLTLHRHLGGYGNAGEPGWYDRWIDGSVGWSDGRAEMYHVFVRSGWATRPLQLNFGLQ